MTRTTSGVAIACFSLSLYLTNGFLGNVVNSRRRYCGDTFLKKSGFTPGIQSCRTSPTRSVCYSWSPFSSMTEEGEKASSSLSRSTDTLDRNKKNNEKQLFSSWSTSSSVKDEPWDALSSSSSSNSNEIEDLERWLGKEGDGWERTILPLGIAAVLAISTAIVSPHIDVNIPTSITEVTHGVEQFFADPNAALQNVVQRVEDMGPLGPLYFGVAYTIAEILAIPAVPLTASAGYLFGVTTGTAVVLFSASIAAAVSFVIGRTLLRSYVEGILEDQPRMKKIDKAIGKEGFKLMLLLRLSPIFPFALSNYLYGATSVKFWPYFFGTMLGFTPGTIAYVYTGEVGKALTAGQDSAQPWYIYACGFTLLLGFIKVASDTATGIIEGLEEEEG
mmetsp:Transcript_7747/g.11095  ORF Transcript_7747/g.11095 Transcript_7747/m.11095 type:complete len:389 (+) Transcript_7747:185-1351(+)